MNKKLITSTLVGLPLVVSSAMAAPNQHQSRNHLANTPSVQLAAPNLARFEKKLERVGLNKVQHQKVDQIIQHSGYLMRGNFKQMRNFEKKLNTMALSPSYNQRQARKMAMNHADTIASMLVIQADTKHQIFDVLTPKQRKTLLSLKPSKKKRRGRKKA